MDFFPTKALHEEYFVAPKIRVELRMLRASASIRSEPKWDEQLDGEDKRQEWATRVKGSFELTDREVDYVFEELKYYALLKKNGNDGEELGPVDDVWVASAANDSELAKEFKRNAKDLECGIAKAAPSVGLQALVDPFMHPLVTNKSYILTKSIEFRGTR
ncbi:hypothetical protein GGI20_002438 [Coemansia sp. BCRC 34301]|nr:hypothetical protein GGI20_002438 [Coemansia sp. BCRC 34301]